MIHFREATKADINSIAELHSSSWKQTYKQILSDEFLAGPIETDRQKCWSERLNTPSQEQFILIAAENSLIIGFICAYCKKDQKRGNHIDNLHVHILHQGKGIGSALLKKAAQWLLNHDPKTNIYLWAYEKNTEACKLYDKIQGSIEEHSMEPAADGRKVMSLRYTWPNPQALLDGLAKQ